MQPILASRHMSDFEVTASEDLLASVGAAWLRSCWRCNSKRAWTRKFQMCISQVCEKYQVLSRD
ncbi:hypothetical protein Plhal703r1_c15g0074801 [Plasmopara halstedii]